MSPQRITLFVNQSTVKRARGQAVEEGVSLSKLMEIALEQYLPKVVKVTVVGAK